MATKKVTFVQSKDNGGVKKVRIDDVEVDVVSAMPTIINGQIAVTMTLVGVDLGEYLVTTSTKAAAKK